MRRFLLPIGCFVAAVLVSVAAIADHRNKTARGNHAQLLEWYCQHVGTHCHGPSSERIEERWETRELGYKVGFSALLIVGLATAAYRVRRR